ncbi:MAG: sphingosine kinase [Verrucomicrobia bacterium]|nr:sphingosine kinase [Verrucomicrobiota bacterium]
MHPPIEVILNARAGSGPRESGREDIQAEFRKQGGEAVVSLVEASGLSELARKKAAGGAQVIVAAGGDGTLAAVAAALLGTDKVMGVLPLGTLNHFSKDLHIPQSLEGAVQTVLKGRVARIDVGDVNGRIFLNNSSLGVYPVVVADRVGQQRRLGRGKWRAFAAALFHLLNRYPRLNLEVAFEGRKISRRSPFLFVGNNPYELSGFDLGARRRLDSGQLGLYLTSRTGRFDLLRLLTRAFFGRLEQQRDFESFAVTEARVETSQRELLVATDGEVARMSGPLHYRTHPAALRVMVPRGEEKAPG